MKWQFNGWWSPALGLMTSLQYLLELQRVLRRIATYKAETYRCKKYAGAYGISIHYGHNMIKH
jgi:hypothetical protein